MTVILKDLQKLDSAQQKEDTRKELFQMRKGKFWIWDKQQYKLEDIKTNGDWFQN